VHLTNHQVQKNYEKFHDSEIKENQWSLSMFKEYLAKMDKADAWETVIKPKIDNLVVTSLRSWPKEGHRDYSFELLGFDILLDENLNPYLLEINTNPGNN
jgi:D-alanine-D-alanine ligase-like ATP-grasp enzyme